MNWFHLFIGLMVTMACLTLIPTTLQAQDQNNEAQNQGGDVQGRENEAQEDRNETRQQLTINDPLDVIRFVEEAGRRATEPPPPSRFSIDFSGGTIKNYVKAIGKAHSQSGVNIVVMPSAKDIVIPPVRLVEVTLQAAISMLEGDYECPDGQDVSVSVKFYWINGSPDPLFKILAQDSKPTISSSRVWSLAETLECGPTEEEILGAVEAALSVHPSKPKVTFHPPTSLLIVRGIHEQINLVEDALLKMLNNARRRTKTNNDLRGRLEFLNEEARRLEMENQVAQQELAVAESRLERRLEERKVDTALPEDVAEAELAVTEARSRRELTVERRGRILAEITDIEKQLKEAEHERE